MFLLQLCCPCVYPNVATSWLAQAQMVVDFTIIFGKKNSMSFLKTKVVAAVWYGHFWYKCQTYRNSHLFGKSVSPCIFLILIYTDQEHTGTHTFSKCAGKVSDLKRCEFLYVLATHVIWSGTYKNLHLFKILWKQSYQFRCESLYVPCLYI